MRFYCPILRPGTSLPCDQEALYLIDGTALCRRHAQEVGAEFPPAGSPEPGTDGGGADHEDA